MLGQGLLFLAAHQGHRQSNDCQARQDTHGKPPHDPML
jgi:hypothetical protein